MTTPMEVLIIGRGGREHALAWKLAQSSRVAHVWVAPGNGGTRSDGLPSKKDSDSASVANVPLDEHDFASLIDFARQKGAGLSIVGPEAPLASGIVDAFQAAGLNCFGPTQAAAQMEASKAFAKAFMARHNIPTGQYATFTDYQEALGHLRHVDYDVVIKASGLAAGKGVIVPDSVADAGSALRKIMVERAFGKAGDEVVIEERLYGQEASVLAFSDGQTVVTMPVAQDHKPVFDGDLGPNTGGMGAYAPAPLITNSLLDEIACTILQPTVDGLRDEGVPYVGVLYAGLMINTSGPRVLEYNCRFGDPETQVILPLLETDLADVLDACLDGSLDQLELMWRTGSATTVVASSGGYPGSYSKGEKINGVEEADGLPRVVVFHAGTRWTQEGQLVTDGGRVLSVTGVGEDLKQSIDRAYDGMCKIHFKGIHFRQDIGAKASGVIQ